MQRDKHKAFKNACWIKKSNGVIFSNYDIYRVSEKTWEFSDEFDIVFVMN